MVSSIQVFLEEFFPKFNLLLPEVVMALGALVLLILGFFRFRSIIFIGTYTLTLVGAIVASFYLSDEAIFLPFRNLVCVMALLNVCFFANNSIFQPQYISESLFLLMASALGLNMMMLAEDLLSLFVALELAAIASYILVILSWKKNSLEGAIKYLLFGVFASALMLYGISWLYGLSGGIRLEAVSWSFPVGSLHYIALFMTLAGLLMKIAAVPYHLWAPDAYQIAPTPVVAFLATASKIAGVVAILKILNAYEAALPDISLVVAYIAMISIFWGNLVALWQKNLKRMLAYSSIANAGYLLIGAVTPKYREVLFFFLLAYSIANVLILMIAEYYEQNYQYTDVEHFAGVGKSNPFVALALLIGFVSLAGLPPTAGFTAKLLIFSALWEKFEASKQNIFLIWLIIGLLNTVVALFYYLKVPYFAFFKDKKEVRAFTVPVYLLIGVALLSLFLIWFFLKPV